MTPNTAWSVTPVEDRRGQQDHPRAGPEGREAGTQGVAQRTGQARGLEQERQRGRLPSGHHDPGQSGQVPGVAHLAHRLTELGEGRGVLPHVTLEGEDPDRHPRAPVRRPAARLPATVGQVHAERADLLARHGLAQPGRHLGHQIGVGEVGGGLDDGPGHRRRVGALEDPRTHEDGLGAELHDQRGVGRGGDAAGAEQRNGQPPGGGDLLDQADRGGELLGPAVELGRIGLGHPPDVPEDGPQVPDGLHDVAGPRLPLGADHGRALGDPPQGLAQVGGAADEGHLEVPLVDVVGLVGRGEDLALVDVVDPEGGQHLGLGEVADAGLGHDRDRSRPP